MSLTPFENRLVAHKEQIAAFTAGPVWELWLELAKVWEEAYMHNSVHAATLEEREFNRCAYKALQKFKSLPFAMVQKVETISREQVS